MSTASTSVQRLDNIEARRNRVQMPDGTYRIRVIPPAGRGDVWSGAARRTTNHHDARVVAVHSDPAP